MAFSFADNNNPLLTELMTTIGTTMHFTTTWMILNNSDCFLITLNYCGR